MLNVKKHLKRKTKIYSLKYGVGAITGIFRLHDGIEDYIEITFYKDKIVKKFPVSDMDQLRIISNLTVLTLTLRELARKINCDDFKNKYIFNQRIGVDMNVGFVVNAIASLSNRAKINNIDKTMLSECLNSLILEVSHVYNVNEKSARGIVSDHMRCA